MEVCKWREDEEQDASSYSVTLRKIEVTGNWKRNHYITLCGELALEEAIDDDDDNTNNNNDDCSSFFGHLVMRYKVDVHR